jgi:hypothetical protein
LFIAMRSALWVNMKTTQEFELSRIARGLLNGAH